MKRSLILKSFTLILLVLVFGMFSVGCFLVNGGGATGTPETPKVDKTALNAELALEVKEQGDYTDDSYSIYSAKLTAAKTVAADEKATQAAVDSATEALKAARSALTVRSVEAVKGASKDITISSGVTKEITLSDYVNVNGLSKITYKIQTSNEILTLGEIKDGKFTILAGEVVGEMSVKVSINVYYDNTAKLSVELSVKVVNEVAPTLSENEVVREYDLATLGNKESIVINFAENVNNVCDLALNYSVKCGNEELVLDGSSYTFIFDSYTVEYTYVTFNVTLSFTVNGEAKTLEYTYKLGIKDTGKYSVVNGGFENGLDGWTFTNTVGEAPFAGIDNKTHFWDQNFPVFNVGSYFSAYADGASEASQGTLASSYFTVNSDYATYMLGGAGNPNVYITIENKDGEVLALYRNTMFADIPGDITDFDTQRELLGDTIFLVNLVTYKVDLSGFRGEEVRVVVHDHASENWGVVFFDELVTYYASADELPEGAVLAENLLADRSALDSELALEVKEQGDYTLDSFSAYLEKLAEVKTLASDVAVAQATLDEAVKALSEARLGLTVRPIEEIDGADKSFRTVSGDVIEILLSDYVNVNGLRKITYEIAANSALVTIGSITDGKFTVTVGEAGENTDVTVSVDVLYDGVKKHTVELSVMISADLAPIVILPEISEEYDVYTLADKTGITIDLSENVDNIGNLTLSYAVEYKGEKTDLDGSDYTFALGSYTDALTYEVLTVTVSYVSGENTKSVSYTYTLGVKDTSVCRVENGGFENGLDGWKVVGAIGNVSSDTHYWVNDPEIAEGYLFGMDGEKMFSAYAEGAYESAVGTLTSSAFKLGGAGFITFKVGAMRDANYVYVDVVDATSGQILARYYNGLWAERTNDIKSGCTLIAYKADLSAFVGREVYIRVSDNAESGYGLFFADSFVTYYESEPEGFEMATPVEYKLPATVYDVFNGGFEMGDVQGWWNDGQPGAVTGADMFFDGIAYGKDGDFLYSGVEDAYLDEEGNVVKSNNGREGNRGVLTSSVFELGGTGYISFMLGGGGNVLCYVQVIDAVSGEIVARYHQEQMDGAVLKQYVADLSAYVGRTLRIQVVDQADRDWGCVAFDNVVTYYASVDVLPEGAITATDIKGNIKHTIENGSFETGNIDGWTMDVTEEGVHGTLGWVLDTEYDVDWYTKNDETKDGNFLFTFVKPEDINCESSKGTLVSSTFSLKQGAFVSFRFGGAGSDVAHINHDVFVELCRADGSVIATFYNDAEGKTNTKMNAYYYQYGGVEVDCFFRVVDNSVGNYGCFVVDDFRVNLESAPEGFIAAIQ